DAESDHDREDQHQSQGYQKEHAPTGSTGGGGLIEVLLQQNQILAVCLPAEIEEVTQKRDLTYDCIDSDIRHHAEECSLRGAQPGSMVDDADREDRSDSVTQAGNQTDDGIQAEAVLRPRNGNRVVQEAR